MSANEEPRCAVCGGLAEVAHPDGRGDQVHYCGVHEPEEG
jgi:hypothetical protein